jgi:fructokinase
MPLYGCIEAGGTKFVCGVGTCPQDLATVSFPTTSPADTLREAVSYFRGQSALHAVGIASFGPVDLESSSPTYGYITETPKLAWQHFNLAGEIRSALRLPVGFDTDVNAAALGEARWGAGRDCSDFLYLTIGTGIGGGAIVNNQLLHGLVHPEMGHIRVPHDRQRDPYDGHCPFHGNCLEGLACGPSIEQRWGERAENLPPEHSAWPLEAHYLALGLSTWVCTLSPKRIIMGGGIMQQQHLFPRVRGELATLLNGYIPARELGEEIDSYVVPPLLADRAGALGAIVLAEQAWSSESAARRNK